jgi:hypothetical protein
VIKVLECIATITVPQLRRTLRKKVPAGDESRKNSDNNVSRKDDRLSLADNLQQRKVFAT